MRSEIRPGTSEIQKYAVEIQEIQSAMQLLRGLSRSEVSFGRPSVGQQLLGNNCRTLIYDFFANMTKKCNFKNYLTVWESFKIS